MLRRLHLNRMVLGIAMAATLLFPVTALRAGGSYAVGTATAQNGMPLILRGLSHFPQDHAEADFPHFVSLYWDYTSRNGMPQREANAAQVRFEDDLMTLDRPDLGRLILVVTGNNLKAWHWQVRDVDVWLESFERLDAVRSGCPIEIETGYDPEWSLLKDFHESMKAAPQNPALKT